MSPFVKTPIYCSLTHDNPMQAKILLRARDIFAHEIGDYVDKGLTKQHFFVLTVINNKPEAGQTQDPTWSDRAINRLPKMGPGE